MNDVSVLEQVLETKQNNNKSKCVFSSENISNIETDNECVRSGEEHKG